ncbi:MAG: hypothetical protein Q8P13_00365 [bacterium]|nr:hypothetical protein [bacterium]
MITDNFRQMQDLVYRVISGKLLPEWVGPTLINAHLAGQLDEQQFDKLSLMLRRATVINQFLVELTFRMMFFQNHPAIVRSELKEAVAIFKGYPWSGTGSVDLLVEVADRLLLGLGLEPTIRVAEAARLAAMELDRVIVFGLVVHRLEGDGLVEPGAIETGEPASVS